MANITGKYAATNLKAIRDLLERLGFNLVSNPSYTLAAKGQDCSIFFYKTNVVLIQGSKDKQLANSLVENGLIQVSEAKNGQRKQPHDRSLTNLLLPRIGSDESGKGDYFGPLVTAAVMVNEKTQYEFERLGIRDSKTISDKVIHELAPQIFQLGTAVYVPIGPEKYNELYPKMKSVNRLLAWAHARAIENILEKGPVSIAVADQFGDPHLIENALLEKGRKIELRQMPKAESDIAVAAASIIARNEFVTRLKELGDDFGITLPKGASQAVVDVAVTLAKRHGIEVLRKVAKLHFKTTDVVKAYL